MSVYYIHSPDTGLVKIGYARRPLARLGKMQVDSPTRLVLLAVETGDIELERLRHTQFRSLRARGEWFHFEGELEAHVGELKPFERPGRKPMAGPLGAWMHRNKLTIRQAGKLLQANIATLSAICNGRQKAPTYDLMLRIYIATNGEVQPNDFYDLPQLKSAQQDAAA